MQIQTSLGLRQDEDTRCLWKNPWWTTQKEPPPLTEEELDPSRDICFEHIGVSPVVMGRRLLIRAPLLRKSGGMVYPELSQDKESKKFQIGMVLAVGKHAFPPSPTYGTDGSQIFCRPGDWVEYSYWEKSESVLNINAKDERLNRHQLHYVNDLHVNSVIRPRDYYIILNNRC